ncbi:hypothetical protein GCM10011491_45190 [Brucella endophytica]|uniref:Nucleotidyl transferase domain-containing protein n=1 Tax=Brucella endophytica TaxID=1963359 RepID=A0A916SR78_9HYPH|nr:hypothetical protein GCM10011491_45190 [Brucella endophytica]
MNYTVEDTPLGTGGGLLLAMERLDDDEPFLLLNGDTYFDVEARKLLEFHTGKSSGITFALFRAGEPERFGGVRVDADSRITELQSSKAGIGQLANGGIYVIDPKAIKEKYRANGNKISFEDDILPGLFNAGTAFFGLESHGSFVDIGVPKDYVAASSIMFQQSGGSENV